MRADVGADAVVERVAHLACQVLHQESFGEAGLLVDLVTLEPAVLDDGELAAGAPLTLAFDSTALSKPRPRLISTMGRWAAAGAVIDVEVRTREGGLIYVFTGLTEQVILDVDVPVDGGGFGAT